VLIVKLKKAFIAAHKMDDWLEVEGEVKNQCFFWLQELSIFLTTRFVTLILEYSQ
jgi:hypothetical protein